MQCGGDSSLSGKACALPLVGRHRGGIDVGLVHARERGAGRRPPCDGRRRCWCAGCRSGRPDPGSGAPASSASHSKPPVASTTPRRARMVRSRSPRCAATPRTRPQPSSVISRCALSPPGCRSHDRGSPSPSRPSARCPCRPARSARATAGAAPSRRRSAAAGATTTPLFTSRNVRLRGTGERRMRSRHGPARPRRSRQRRQHAAAWLAARCIGIEVGILHQLEAQRRALLEKGEHCRRVRRKGLPQRVLLVVPAGRRGGAQIGQRLIRRNPSMPAARM